MLIMLDALSIASQHAILAASSFSGSTEDLRPKCLSDSCVPTFKKPQHVVYHHLIIRKN